MDKRVYNGCPSDDLQQLWDYTDKKVAELKEKFPTAWITYFPLEGKYMAAMWGENGEFIQLSDEMFPDKISLVNSILNQEG